MDLRLPPLPDLPPPKLVVHSGPSDVSTALADSRSNAQDAAAPGSIPSYLETLMHLQKLQDQAFASFQTPVAHEPSSSSSSVSGEPEQLSRNALSKISGADAARIASELMSSDQRPAAAFSPIVSSSFLEVDEQYLADPPLLELDGNSVSASPTLALLPPSEPPPAAVVPAGIVAQRRKSFAEQAASAAYQRPSFVPEVQTDIVSSAGYLKSIVHNARTSASDAGVCSSAPFSFAQGGPVELALPAANEPSSNLAPPPNFRVYSGRESPGFLPDFDVMQQPHTDAASSQDFDVSQLEQLSESSLKEFFIKVVDMMDSASVSARSRAMVALCNFLSKGQGRDKINLDGLSTLLPKFLCFLPADTSSVLTDAETYLAGATSGTICNLSNSSSIRKQCCDMGFLGRLVALIAQNEVFSSRHATGALWNLVVDNDEAKMFLAGDRFFRDKLSELFGHADHQVSKHALGLASEMCCRNVQAKELFCSDACMQLLISIVRDCNAVDVARRNSKLRSCCLLICNVLANSPGNKSIALKLGLFDVVLPLVHRDDPELCAVVAGIIVNLPPWQHFRDAIKHAGLFPVIKGHSHSANQSLARNATKLLDWLAISKKHKKPFFVKPPNPINLKLIFGQ